ncbi:hypothetical protein [Anatilimnocola aggregata]|uniref:hypothetical protein n=1 Tax=Anatilimnocola aggregata TaxID=2528021 RepID=UPI00119D4BBB|nr:hypothetical protein [Anatilimnocola aggregata]
MTERTMEERVATLEQVVATQSDMLIKLVEMMNHLGQETAGLSERLQAVSDSNAQRLEKIGNMFQSLVSQMGGKPDASSN